MKETEPGLFQIDGDGELGIQIAIWKGPNLPKTDRLTEFRKMGDPALVLPPIEAAAHLGITTEKMNTLLDEEGWFFVEEPEPSWVSRVGSVEELMPIALRRFLKKGWVEKKDDGFKLTDLGESELARLEGRLS